MHPLKKGRNKQNKITYLKCPIIQIPKNLKSIKSLAGKYVSYGWKKSFYILVIRLPPNAPLGGGGGMGTRRSIKTPIAK